MIILDAQDQRRFKLDLPAAGPTLRRPEKAVSRSDSPLPDYETSEARQKFLLQHASQHKILDRRLLRAILYALLIYVIISVVIGVPIVLLKTPKHSEKDEPSWEDPPSSFALSNTGLESLGDIKGCNWTTSVEDHEHEIFTGRVQHNLTSSGSLFIRSNTSCTPDDTSSVSGNLTVGLNPDPSAIQVLFQVDVAASSSELLHNTGACFNDDGDNRSLFIYTAGSTTSLDYLELNISILFPNTARPSTFDNFITYLPGFVQSFGNLTDYVYFTNLAIEGAWRDILSTAMAASRISVKNSFGSIRGAYHATTSISLDTIKGNITTDITLENDPSGQTSTSLTLDTGDGEIDSRVTLIAPTTHTFVGEVKTFNGPLTLHVAHDPSTLPMPLQLSVQNNVAPTKVYLDKKFQGLFSAQTKLDTVTVQQFNETDPLGLGRQRSVVFSRYASEVIQGWVGWGQRPLGGDSVTQGQVKITTSLSPVLLQLGSGS